MKFEESINELYSSQLHDWELAKVNYAQLGKVRTRSVDFGSFEVLVQFNPERIRSSAAKVDSASINERPCFLCEKNRPAQQRGLSFNSTHTILINPYPVFERHLTIPSDLHTDQRIRNNFTVMLMLAETLQSYTVFYNGPECGASAPDHFHFQAGKTGIMPLEKDWLSGKMTRLISGNDDIELWLWTGYDRGIISLAGKSMEKLNSTFLRIYDRLAVTQPGKPEPMINILANYISQGWVIHLIPRKKHRPSQYFAEDSGQFVISPAAVDLGGLIICPREEDFSRITKADIEDIFGQVCFSEEELSCIINELI